MLVTVTIALVVFLALIGSYTVCAYIGRALSAVQLDSDRKATARRLGRVTGAINRLGDN